MIILSTTDKSIIINSEVLSDALKELDIEDNSDDDEEDEPKDEPTDEEDSEESKFGDDHNNDWLSRRAAVTVPCASPKTIRTFKVLSPNSIGDPVIQSLRICAAKDTNTYILTKRGGWPA